jgi:Arabinogalactan endo-1,4-beta-galactosidase
MKTNKKHFFWIVGLVLLLGPAVFCFADDDPAEANNKIINSGFDKDAPGKNFTVSDWTVVSDNDKDAVFTESGWNITGLNKLTNWKDKDFKCYTYQTVQNLPQGLYNFSFYYANGNGGNDCYVEIKDFGGNPVKIPTVKSPQWIQKEAKGIKITSGKCTIGIYSDAKAGYWINLDDFILVNQKDLPAEAAPGATEDKKPERLIANEGFENGDDKTISEWEIQSDKDWDASYRESKGAHSGEYKLTNYKDRDYRVYTYQTVKDLKKGLYVLEFWYTNDGKQKDCYVEVKDFGGKTIRETLPTCPKWWKVTIPNIAVTSGECTIGFNTDAKAKYRIDIDDVKLLPDESKRAYGKPEEIKLAAKEYPLRIKGIDLSTLTQVERGGGKFYDLNGEPKDIFAILKENGVNLIRLRIWNDPKTGDCNEASTLAMAKRIKTAGMGFMLDFHYSDTWTDPVNQAKPAAWSKLDFEGLNQALYDYTKQIITDLRKQHTLPDMVQIGNEIRGGLLFPDGQLTDIASFQKLARFIGSAAKGVHDASPNKKIKIVIHLDKGADNASYNYFFDNLIANGVPFDVIGLSYYVYWHGPMSGFYDNLCKLAEKYHKEMVVAETAYPFTFNPGDELANMLGDDTLLRTPGYPATIAGQKQFLETEINLIKHVPDGLALGFIYWEGAWLPVKGAGWDPNDAASGDAWENQGLFNYNGYALDSLKVFRTQ